MRTTVTLDDDVAAKLKAEARRTGKPFKTVLPGERYWDVLKSLLHRAQVSGPLVTDAALAALAIEHGAVLCTTDRDFARFPELRTVNPLDD
jgi:predicted nucleic acid-binding protein